MPVPLLQRVIAFAKLSPWLVAYRHLPILHDNKKAAGWTVMVRNRRQKSRALNQSLNCLYIYFKLSEHVCQRVLRKSEEKGNSASVEAWIDRLYD